MIAIAVVNRNSLHQQMLEFSFFIYLFTAGCAFDQIRNSLAYPHLNVKVVGTHTGLSVGKDEPTHQCLEDIGLMRKIPRMTILCPCDAYETRQAVEAMWKYQGPVYLRLGSAVAEVVCEEFPVPVLRVGMKDSFGKSGRAEDLMIHYHLTKEEVIR